MIPRLPWGLELPLGTLLTDKAYKPREVAEMWGFSIPTIRKMFMTEPGVILLVRGRGPKDKQAYVSMRIPATVLERVRRRLAVR